MKFIFPKNYNFKNKLFGIIDYPTAIFNLILLFIFYKISALFFCNIFNRLLFLIIFNFPLILLSIFSFSNESFLFVAYYILLYLFKPKLYLYK